MADVYRIREGREEHAWHGTVEALKRAHPGAVITDRLVMDEVGQGRWEPISHRQAQAHERKAAEGEPEEKKEDKRPKRAKDEVPAEAPAADVPESGIVIEFQPAPDAEKAE